MVLYTPGVLEENSEDLQNAKRHIAISLIAAESYQSLKQMAYQLHGFVLDMSTTPHRGDLSKIMLAEDDGIRLIHFTNHFLRNANSTYLSYFSFDNHYYCR